MQSSQPGPTPAGNLDVTQRPFYHTKRRELWVGNRLVKAYRQPAPAQHAILVAFQKQGWPDWIPNPLPPKPGRDSKLDLRETIKRLNLHQREHLIRFESDGRGTGILWKLSYERA